MIIVNVEHYDALNCSPLKTGEDTVKLSPKVVQSVKKAGVDVYYADRRITRLWNKERGEGQPVFFGGWYWVRNQKGKVVAWDEDGPFRSESAAVRDAYTKLQLRPLK